LHLFSAKPCSVFFHQKQNAARTAVADAAPRRELVAAVNQKDQKFQFYLQNPSHAFAFAGIIGMLMWSNRLLGKDVYPASTCDVYALLNVAAWTKVAIVSL
jgi:hypothetical protein